MEVEPQSSIICLPKFKVELQFKYKGGKDKKKHN